MVKGTDLRSVGQKPRGFESHRCHFFIIGWDLRRGLFYLFWRLVWGVVLGSCLWMIFKVFLKRWLKMCLLGFFVKIVVILNSSKIYFKNIIRKLGRIFRIKWLLEWFDVLRRLIVRICSGWKSVLSWGFTIRLCFLIRILLSSIWIKSKVFMIWKCFLKVGLLGSIRWATLMIWINFWVGNLIG